MNIVVAFRIAWRNIGRNSRRAMMFAGSLFFSCFLLLVSTAVFNGSGDRIREDMTEFITGDVGIFWSTILEYGIDDPERPFGSEFDIETDESNRAAIARLEEFLSEHSAEIRSGVPYLMQSATAYVGSETAVCMVYGVAAPEYERLRDGGILVFSGGEDPGYGDSGIYVSRDFAETNGLSRGDTLTIEARTAYGGQNALDATVTGIFDDKAPWLNSLVLCTENFTRELLDTEAPYFKAFRIMLADGTDADAFAETARNFLSRKTDLLTAETAYDAGRMMMTLAESQKSIMVFISVIMIVVIGIGLRSTTRMVLFQRMREIGTLRALGFSRRQCFSLILLESMILGMLALASAVFCSSLLVFLLDRTGIPIPPGPLRYMFGGDLLFPRLAVSDIVFTAGLIAALAFIAPFKPAGTLLFNGITNLLSGRQKRVSLLVRMIGSVFYPARPDDKTVREVSV